MFSHPTYRLLAVVSLFLLFSSCLDEAQTLQSDAVAEITTTADNGPIAANFLNGCDCQARVRSSTASQSDYQVDIYNDLGQLVFSEEHLFCNNGIQDLNHDTGWRTVGYFGGFNAHLVYGLNYTASTGGCPAGATFEQMAENFQVLVQLRCKGFNSPANPAVWDYTESHALQSNPDGISNVLLIDQPAYTSGPLNNGVCASPDPGF